MFTEAAWRPIRQHYLSYSNLNEKERKDKRKFFMSVEEILCDRQGRMNIPQFWRDKSGLKNRVVIIGVGDHIELWSEERFRKLEEDDDYDFEENSKETEDAENNE